MSKTSEISQHENNAPPEHYDLGTLISAVGNSEAKAAVYTIMPDDQYLTVTGVKRAVEKLQSPNDVRRTAASVYANYCESSYVPIGLVAKFHVDERSQVTYRKVAVARALALSGALLDISEQLPSGGLRHLMSSSSTPHHNRADNGIILRGPHARISLLGVLAASNIELRLPDLAEATGIKKTNLTQHLKEMNRAGIVSYETKRSRDIDPIYTPGPVHGELHGPVRGKILSLVMANPEGIKRSEAIRALGGSVSNNTFMAAFRHASTHLQKSGYISLEDTVSREDFSATKLNDDWRDVVSELVSRLAHIKVGQPTTLKYWSRKGQSIVGDPKLLSTLMHKSFDNSQLSRTRRELDTTYSEFILNALDTNGDTTQEEFVTSLPNAMRKRSLASALYSLKELGIITSSKNAKGYNVYSLSSQNHD